jgi:hypothetical protein
MNSKIKNRTLGATALLAVLLGSAACGSETVSDGPGNQPAAKPPIAAPKGHGGTSADRAEREGAEQKARQDQASTDRWARGTQIESKLTGHPTQR